MKHLIILICLLCSDFYLNNFVIAQNTEDRISWWAKKVDYTGLENLYKLNDSIFRSEQPDSIEFANLKRIGIKSILNIRTQQKDKAISGNQDFNYYFVRMRAERIRDVEIEKTLKIIKDAPKPILIHCKHGSDRTGIVIAMYRIVFENRTKEEALNELQNGGYSYNKIFINIPRYIKEVNILKIRNNLVLF